MNKSEYAHAARRVLNTIDQMFLIHFWKTTLKAQFDNNEDLRLPSISLENAAVESSLIAIRAFDDFIQSKKKFSTDLTASDFDKLVLSSKGIRSSERNKINKRIAHLTTIDITSNQQEYSYDEILEATLPSAIAFCEYVIKELKSDHALTMSAKDIKNTCEFIRARYTITRDT